MAEETVERLARMRRAMVKLHRQGRVREFEAVASAYASLKAELVERVHEEQRAQARARVAARRVEQGERARRWRLPPGFASPLARERAMFGGSSGGPVVPDSRRLALRPWRRQNPASEVIWHPERRR